MIPKVRFSFLILFLLSCFSSCSVFEPASPSAAFVTIDSISLSTQYATEGSSSNAITDAWIILEDGYLGTFPLPAHIPIIKQGNQKITIRGGIIENAIAGLRSAYPKYTSFDTILNFQPGKEIHLQPTIKYGASTTFIQLEDFDDASLSLTSTGASSTNIQITNLGDPNSFEGNSGVVTLDASNTIFETATSTPIVFSQATPSYIELNYKTDNDFTIGVFINYTSGGVEQRNLLSLRATSVWKKLYLSVADLGGVVTNASSYKVFIHCEKNSALTEAKLYFDNLKVLY